MIWPVVLLWIIKTRISTQLALTLLIMIASFLLCLLSSMSDEVAMFFCFTIVRGKYYPVPPHVYGSKSHVKALNFPRLDQVGSECVVF